MSSEYPMWLFLKEITMTKNQDYQIVMIGDSRAKAGFIPLLNKQDTTINLAIGGSTPIEGYYTLYHYLKHNKPPKKLILSYSPEHYVDNSYWNTILKFDFFNKQEYEQILYDSSRLYDHASVDTSRNYVSHLLPHKYTTDLLHGIFEIRWITNKKLLLSCKASKGHQYYGKASYSHALNAEAKKDDFIPSRLIDFYFKKTLTLAHSKNIPVFYYTMPFNQSSFRITKQVFLEKYTSYINDISSNYHIHVCNNLSFLPDDYFGDSSHLYKGSKIVSKNILNCIYN